MMQMEAWCRQHQFPAPPWQHPVFHEVGEIIELLEGNPDQAEELVKNQVKAHHARLQALAGALGRQTDGRTLIDVTCDWRNYLYELDADGRHLGMVAWWNLCSHQLRHWRAVERWFHGDTLPAKHSPGNKEPAKQGSRATEQEELAEAAHRLARRLATRQRLGNGRAPFSDNGYPMLLVRYLRSQRDRSRDLASGVTADRRLG
jgi:hypothetical protein